MSTRRQPSSSIAERIAALEAAWMGFPEKVKAAIAEASKEWTPRDHHEGLTGRVETLEVLVRELGLKSAFAAGAVKVETRVDDQAQQWARTLIPLVWPVCLMASAFFFSGGFNAG